MTQMIRKQIYIGGKQQLLLSRLAKTRGVSEAEVIRQAIEREAGGAYVHPVASDSSHLDDIIRYALSRRELGAAGEPMRWKRDDAYAERLERLGHDNSTA